MICITETHLNDYIANNEIEIQGFKLYRKYRNLYLDMEEINEDLYECEDNFSNGVVLLYIIKRI